MSGLFEARSPKQFSKNNTLSEFHIEIDFDLFIREFELISNLVVFYFIDNFYQLRNI
jgi:hypothetical protein